MPNRASDSRGPSWLVFLQRRGMLLIAGLAIGGIAWHLVLRWGTEADGFALDLPLLIVLIGGGTPLVLGLLRQLIRLEFGSDLLAGLSIVTAVILGEYLAGALVVLMLSGGEALEGYAVRSASSVLHALARRMPSVAHRRDGAAIADVPLDDVRVDDILEIFPNECCPADGVVVEGRSVMDESFLTGEPFRMRKTPGSDVISGAVNGTGALTIRVVRPPSDSRYSRIMKVMRDAEENRPRMRRLADRLGAFYTPLAVLIALLAFAISGDSTRFLAVLVVATPCPLIIAIPVTIIGAISLNARRGIIVRDPGALETISTCSTAIFDKTGTLTYGRPTLTEEIVAPHVALSSDAILALAASLERYSKHPLAHAVVEAAAARRIATYDVSEVSEPPGQGLTGLVDGHRVTLTSRGALATSGATDAEAIPEHGGGLECVVIIDGAYAALLRFRDEPRAEGVSFIRHLGPQHGFDRLLLVSGDRASEVEYLAAKVGLKHVFAEQTPEQKVAIVRDETERARTLYVGDGINDAPALASATVGIAIGQNSDVTSEAADVVILDSSLTTVDEFVHISRRMRTIALQSAIGGIALSVIGMGFASVGLLTPVAGALAQEVIDVAAILNALRAAFPPRTLSDVDD